MKARIKKEIRFWVVLGAIQLSWILPLGYLEVHKVPVEEVVVEEDTELIRWKQETDDEEVYIEVLDVDVVEQAPALVSLGRFKLTAYCPCKHCSDNWGHQTSTGAIATEGRTVAVDPSVIPYGTVLIINGHEYIAEDCGGAIKGNKIDIFFESHEEALEFGVQYAEVFVKVVE